MLIALKAIFSMPVFDWEKYKYSASVRRSIWIFCLLSVVLTLTVLYVWRWWYLRDVWHREVDIRQQEVEGRGETTSAPLPYPLGDQILLQGHEKTWATHVKHKAES